MSKPTFPDFAQEYLGIDNGSILELGRIVAAAHAASSNHGNGSFGQFCKFVGISRQTALDQKAVFETFGDLPKDCPIFGQSRKTALYALAHANQPARDEAVRLAKEGKFISRNLAIKIIRKHGTKERQPLKAKSRFAQSGQLWRLGRHRLLCGDACCPDHVKQLLDGAQAELAICDPPWNVDLKPLTPLVESEFRPVLNDNLPPEDYASFTQHWLKNLADVLTPGRSYFVFTAFTSIGMFQSLLADLNMATRQFIWDKSRTVPSRDGGPSRRFEQMIHGWKRGQPREVNGSRDIADIWKVNQRDPKTSLHQNEKPVSLIQKAINGWTCSGENVLDLFAGSGSTLIAAEKSHRTAYLMEMDPQRCDDIIRRYESEVCRPAGDPVRIVDAA